MKDVRFGCLFFPFFKQIALPLEVIAIVVILKEVLVFLSDAGTVLGVFSEHGHDG